MTTTTDVALRLIRLFQDELTRRQLEVLVAMARDPDDEDCELVRECCDAWLADVRIASRTVDALLRACVLRTVSIGPVERYVINSTALEVLERRGLRKKVEGER